MQNEVKVTNFRPTNSSVIQFSVSLPEHTHFISVRTGSVCAHWKSRQSDGSLLLPLLWSTVRLRLIKTECHSRAERDTVRGRGAPVEINPSGGEREWEIKRDEKNPLTLKGG